MHRSLLISALAFLALALTFTTAAHAQVGQLDKTTLIEGLRKEGLSDMLKHLIETDPPKDPVVAQQVRINQLLLEYSEKNAALLKADDEAAAGRLKTEALKAFMDSLDARRKLIKDFPDHEQRPLWQTDLAEQVLTEYMITIKVNAGEFYETGVPTAEQREAFETLIPEMFEQLSDADDRFFRLQGELPRQPDHVAKRINTGLWDRMMNQYYELRTRYFIALAGHYVLLLPDTNPYFKNLGNPKVILQKRTIPEERKRIEAMAIDKLEKFVKDTGDQWEIKRQCQSLAARVRVMNMNPAAGLSNAVKADEAIALLDLVLAANISDVTDLVARLAKAQALDRKGQPQSALDMVNSVMVTGSVRENLLFRLMAVDQQHRLLMRQAQMIATTPPTGTAPAADRQAVAISEAFAPYQKLLADPALGENALPLRKYIYKRWEATVPPGTETKAPPAVVAAIAETAREAGIPMIEQAGQLDASQKDKAAQLAAQGKEKLKKAIDLCTDVLKRPGLNPETHAQALYNLGVATYYSDQRNPDVQAKAAGLLTDLADQHPEHPLAESAIGDATQVMHTLYAARPAHAETLAGYDRTVKVLLAKYPLSKPADDERVFYATKVLEPANRYLEAADVFSKVPQQNPNYFFSLLHIVFNLQSAYREAAPEKQAGLADKLQAEIKRVLDECERAKPPEGTEQERMVRQAAGWATIISADMKFEHGKKTEEAIQILANFDDKFAMEAELIRVMLQKRIVYYLKAGRLDDSLKEAVRMMEKFPDEAAGVTNEVLTEIDVQIEDLNRRMGTELVASRKKDLETQKLARAEAAVTLSKYLYEWATKRKYEGDKLLPFQLILAKSLRLVGKFDESLKLVDPLVKAFPKSAEAILNRAEALYGLGRATNPPDAARLKEARGMYGEISRGITPNPETRKYPSAWWQARLRLLQINDALNENTEDINRIVRQLEGVDPSLGGDAFKSEYIRLRTKYQLTK